MSPYLAQRPRELPEVADMLRAEVRRRRNRIEELQAYIDQESLMLSDAEHHLDVIQRMMSARLRSDAPHWLVEVIDG